jgi:hypothetical protein
MAMRAAQYFFSVLALSLLREELGQTNKELTMILIHQQVEDIVI